MESREFEVDKIEASASSDAPESPPKRPRAERITIERIPLACEGEGRVKDFFLIG